MYTWVFYVVSLLQVFQLKCYTHFATLMHAKCPASPIFGDLQIVMNSVEE